MNETIRRMEAGDTGTTLATALSLVPAAFTQQTVAKHNATVAIHNTLTNIEKNPDNVLKVAARTSSPTTPSAEKEPSSDEASRQKELSEMEAIIRRMEAGGTGATALSVGQGPLTGAQEVPSSIANANSIPPAEVGFFLPQAPVTSLEDAHHYLTSNYPNLTPEQGLAVAKKLMTAKNQGTISGETYNNIVIELAAMSRNGELQRNSLQTASKLSQLPQLPQLATPSVGQGMPSNAGNANSIPPTEMEFVLPQAPVTSIEDAHHYLTSNYPNLTPEQGLAVAKKLMTAKNQGTISGETYNNIVIELAAMSRNGELQRNSME